MLLGRTVLSSATKLLVALALLGQIPGVNAGSIGTPSSFNGLTWSYSSNAPATSGCSRLMMDFMGDMYQSKALAVHGALNCSAGGYAVTGTMYTGANGTYNMTVQLGAGIVLICGNLPTNTISGACGVYDGNGMYLGNATITLL